MYSTKWDYYSGYYTIQYMSLFSHSSNVRIFFKTILSAAGPFDIHVDQYSYGSITRFRNYSYYI